MASPSPIRVRIDAQGRMVVPLALREEIVTPPGEVLIRRTPEGLLLTSTTSPGVVATDDDGMPVLRLGRRVTNDEVLHALDRERAER